MSQVTAVAWVDAAGLEHLRNRRVLVHTLGEVSELHRLRTENKQLRTMLVDEMIKRHDVMRMLEAAVSRLGMKVSEFKAEFARTSCNTEADSSKLDESVRN